MDDLDFLNEVRASPTDEAVKWVYADWLEDRGDERGEYLRLTLRVRAGEKLDRRDRRRFRKLVARISQRWLPLTTSPPIENCEAAKGEVEFDYECPLEWQGLKPLSSNSQVRYCEQCEKRVYFCLTVDVARRKAAEGQCVAIALGNVRRRHDISTYRVQLRMGRMRRV